MSRKIIKGNFESGGVEGVGNISSAMVLERAIELAVIDGRGEDEVTPYDLDRAEQELNDGDEWTDLAWHDLPGELSNPLSGDPIPSSGSQAAYPPFDDDIDTTEQLVQQGMDEALHDEMLEAGKQTLAEALDTSGDQSLEE